MDNLKIINSMVEPITKKVTCPNCGAENYITIYDTIYPELVEKMESGELFIYECPKCGKKYRHNYHPSTVVRCIYPMSRSRGTMQFIDKVDENNQRELDKNNHKKHSRLSLICSWFAHLFFGNDSRRRHNFFE